MAEQKIKQDISIGANIRKIRAQQKIGQTELVRLLQLEGVEMTRETLVKIERGTQHIRASQLRGIRDALHTTYDALLEPGGIGFINFWTSFSRRNAPFVEKSWIMPASARPVKRRSPGQRRGRACGNFPAGFSALPRCGMRGRSGRGCCALNSRGPERRRDRWESWWPAAPRSGFPGRLTWSPGCR